MGDEKVLGKVEIRNLYTLLDLKDYLFLESTRQDGKQNLYPINKKDVDKAYQMTKGRAISVSEFHEEVEKNWKYFSFKDHVDPKWVCQNLLVTLACTGKAMVVMDGLKAIYKVR